MESPLKKYSIKNGLSKEAASTKLMDYVENIMKVSNGFNILTVHFSDPLKTVNRLFALSNKTSLLCSLNVKYVTVFSGFYKELEIFEYRSMLTTNQSSELLPEFLFFLSTKIIIIGFKNGEILLVYLTNIAKSYKKHKHNEKKSLYIPEPIVNMKLYNNLLYILYDSYLFHVFDFTNASENCKPELIFETNLPIMELAENGKFLSQNFCCIDILKRNLFESSPEEAEVIISFPQSFGILKVNLISDESQILISSKSNEGYILRIKCHSVQDYICILTSSPFILSVCSSKDIDDVIYSIDLQPFSNLFSQLIDIEFATTLSISKVFLFYVSCYIEIELTEDGFVSVDLHYFEDSGKLLCYESEVYCYRLIFSDKVLFLYSILTLTLSRIKDSLTVNKFNKLDVFQFIEYILILKLNEENKVEIISTSDSTIDTLSSGSKDLIIMNEKESEPFLEQRRLRISEVLCCLKELGVELHFKILNSILLSKFLSQISMSSAVFSTFSKDEYVRSLYQTLLHLNKHLEAYRLASILRSRKLLNHVIFDWVRTYLIKTSSAIDTCKLNLFLNTSVQPFLATFDKSDLNVFYSKLAVIAHETGHPAHVSQFLSRIKGTKYLILSLIKLNMFHKVFNIISKRYELYACNICLESDQLSLYLLLIMKSLTPDTDLSFVILPELYKKLTHLLKYYRLFDAIDYLPIFSATDELYQFDRIETLNYENMEKINLIQEPLLLNQIRLFQYQQKTQENEIKLPLYQTLNQSLLFFLVKKQTEQAVLMKRKFNVSNKTFHCLIVKKMIADKTYDKVRDMCQKFHYLFIFSIELLTKLERHAEALKLIQFGFKVVKSKRVLKSLVLVVLDLKEYDLALEQIVKLRDVDSLKWMETKCRYEKNTEVLMKIKKILEMEASPESKTKSRQKTLTTIKKSVEKGVECAQQ